MTKIYLREFLPGTLVSETYIKEVSEKLYPPKLSERAYAFQYFEREHTIKNGEELLGKEKNISKMYYLGTMATADEVIRTTRNPILRSNIEANGYKRLVITRFGQWFPINDNDEVIKDESVIL